MESTPLTFDQLPAYVYELGRKFDDLNALLRLQSGPTQPAPDRWLSIEELSQYLPGKPAISTLYGRVQRREIPFIRKGKRLAFLQSDIDQWLQSGRVKTSAQVSAQATEHLRSKKRRGVQAA